MKNIRINHRSAVHAGSEGVCITKDPCVTGHGEVVFFTNVARSADAANTAAMVKVADHLLCHQQSYFAKSTGDEAGVHGGVRSRTLQGRATFITASGDVFIEGKPAVRQGDTMVSNNRNTLPAGLQQPE
jgi:uncharacterized Zn-binding protein involved in type VI secretion